MRYACSATMYFTFAYVKRTSLLTVIMKGKNFSDLVQHHSCAYPKSTSFQSNGVPELKSSTEEHAHKD